jgi:hypothetical protein
MYDIRHEKFVHGSTVWTTVVNTVKYKEAVRCAGFEDYATIRVTVFIKEDKIVDQLTNSSMIQLLENFRKQYAATTSADIQTFVLGMQSREKEILDLQNKIKSIRSSFSELSKLFF